jgi:hypothetical protein
MDFLTKIDQWKEMLLPLLDDEQQRLLYPEKGTFSVMYRNLSLPILYILLINVCGIPAHKKGWGSSPNFADMSLAANIDRIMEIHKSNFGEVPSKILNQSDFDRFMKEVIHISGKIEEILEGSTKTVIHYQKTTQLEKEHALKTLKGMVINNH